MVFMIMRPFYVLEINSYFDPPRKNLNLRSAFGSAEIPKAVRLFLGLIPSEMPQCYCTLQEKSKKPGTD